MITYLASFLVFLGAAVALGAGAARRRTPGGPCGGCAGRETGACDRPRAWREDS